MVGILEDIEKFVKEHPYITAAVVGLTAAGIAWVVAKNGKRTYTIKAGTKDAGINLFNDLLSNAGHFPEEILLCDPYISSQTLKLFVVFKGKVKKVKILASNIKKNGIKFSLDKRYIEMSCGVSFEIKQNPNLHDRYMLFGDRCLLIGSSLNYLGNKDTTVIEDNELLTGHKKLFEERWDEVK